MKNVDSRALGSSRFDALFRAELEAIDGRRRNAGPCAVCANGTAGAPSFATSPRTGEPRVTDAGRDLAGLALSGGGIRSATFNLGLLQALDEAGLLGMFDYVSTVSGGGYIGGWWTAWLHRTRASGERAALFPTATVAPPAAAAPSAPPAAREIEPAEVRHLREFSRFLIPRLGFFEVETSNAVANVVSVIPASLAGFLAVATLIVGLWLLLAAVCVNPGLVAGIHPSASDGPETAGWQVVTNHPWLAAVSALVYAAIPSGLYYAYYKGATGRRLAESDRAYLHSLAKNAASSLIVIVAVALGLMTLGVVPLHPHATGPDVLLARAAGGGDGLAHSAFEVFAPAVVWAVSVLVLVTGRNVRWWKLLRLERSVPGSEAQLWRTRRILVTMTNRLYGRLLMTAVCWSGMAALWAAGGLLSKVAGIGLGSLGAAASVLFEFVRGRFFGEDRKTARGGPRGKLLALAPKALAYIALVSFGVLIAAGVRAAFAASAVDVAAAGYAFRFSWAAVVFAAAGAFAVATLVAFDPAMISLHNYYRSRIARCYLGASNRAYSKEDRKRGPYAWAAGRPEPARARLVEALEANRFTDERGDDDILLRDLHTAEARGPLHLVCCAANDLAGDPLAGLDRSARSAVLSPLGLALGDHWACHEILGPLRFGQTLTASAAAFNPNMGSLSNDFGAAASVLMAAFNLRLGLWVRWRAASSLGEKLAEALPGRLFFKEMFGRTIAASTPWAPRAAHLSDGGHFENLGLYELVRRHCAYVVVSDCGADPDVLFDDLGRAMQRVREDFGVEIDIDVGPLAPDESGRVAQHAVVGQIFYPEGRIGTLVYVKPALTGEESQDLRQYHAHNPTFPHESTGDQFYDEAQWEAYRKLGEHCGRVTFRFVSRIRRLLGDEPLTPAAVFIKAYTVWRPTPPELGQATLPLTERLTALLRALGESPSAPLLREAFADLQPSAAAAADAAAHARRVVDVLGAMQLIEDVWLGGRLWKYSDHPENAGWMDLFERFAAADDFVRWWPLLKWNFSRELCEFLEGRFSSLAARDEDYWSVIRYPAAEDLARLGPFRDSHAEEAMLGGWGFYYLGAAGAADTTGAAQLALPYRPGVPAGRAGAPPGAVLVAAVRQLRPESYGHSRRDLYWRDEDVRVIPGLRTSDVSALFLQRLCQALRGSISERDAPYSIEMRFEFPLKARPRRAAQKAIHRRAEAFLERGFGPLEIHDHDGANPSRTVVGSIRLLP